jgi:hypothetical protein
MKKILIAGITLAASLGLYAQGSLSFRAAAGTTATGVIFHIYSPQVATPNVEITGNSSVPYSSTVRSGDYPTGTQTYTGTLIGGDTTGSGPTGWANGNNYSVDLLAAAGDNASLSSLTLVAGTTELFNTVSTQAGIFVAASGAVSIPGTTYSGSGVNLPTSASCVVQAWYSGGGAFPTYASAVAANVPAGQSAEFNVDGLGGGNINPPNMVNAQSFSLTTQVPEPSMIALGVMGGCAFLARRRMLKK